MAALVRDRLLAPTRPAMLLGDPGTSKQKLGDDLGQTHRGLINIAGRGHALPCRVGQVNIVQGGWWCEARIANNMCSVGWPP